MSRLRQALEQYLALRRGPGTELVGGGTVLRQFVELLERQRASHITRELALRWAVSAGVEPATWAARLGQVRRFGAWLSTIDSRT